MSGLTKEDLRDAAIVDAIELASPGTTVFITGATVVSTTASTKRIVLSGVDLVHDLDERVEPKDLVTLTGTTAADGTYTIANVIDSVTVDVEETIADSTGGTADVKHPPGAGKVGLDPTNVAGVTATEMQTAMEELSAATGADDKKVQVDAGDASYDYLFAKLQQGTNVTLTKVDTGGGVKVVKIDAATSGITEAQHDALDNMVHWLAETNYQEIIRTAGKVTNVTNWTDSGKTIKVREMIITRAAGKVSQLDFIQYDGAGVENQRMVGVITRSAGKIASVQWTETNS